MRLLKFQDNNALSLVEFVGNNIPRYAVLSHTWGPAPEEATFKDLVDGTGKDKVGWKKIRFCAEQARRDGLQYFWVDTCCINKANNTELSEAINSMYKWYRNAARCYVFLNMSIAGLGRAREQSAPIESAFRAERQVDCLFYKAIFVLVVVEDA